MLLDDVNSRLLLDATKNQFLYSALYTAALPGSSRLSLGYRGKPAELTPGMIRSAFL